MRRRVHPAWLVVALVALAAAAAALYVVLAPDRYVATADIALSPITDDELYRGLPVLRATDAEDRRPVETIARLAGSGAVADRVIRRLRMDSRDDALDAIEVESVPDANAVSIHADASAAPRAAQLANAFADEVVAQRHLQFQSAVVTALTRAREQLTQVPASRRNDAEFLPLSRRVTELRTLEGTGDPTIELASAAVAPDSAERPSWAIVPAAGAGALVLGLLALALTRSREPAPVTQTDPAQVERLERALARLESFEPPEAPPPPPPPAPDTTEIERREALVDRRVAAVAERERELARERAAVAEQGRGLDERAAALDARTEELDQREQELEARPPPMPEPELEPESAPPLGGAYNLEVLERLVEQNADERPERRDEWNDYLVSLREHVGPDGTLPRSFDALVDDVFAELLESRG